MIDNIIIASNPILCSVMEDSGLNIDITARCLIKYEYSVVEQNLYEISFGADKDAAISTLKDKLKAETDSELVVIFAKLSAGGISRKQIEQSGDEISKKLSEYLIGKWKAAYGVGLSINEIKLIFSDDQITMTDGPSMAFNPDNNPVMGVMSQFQTPKTKHRFCMNCGAKLYENAKFCMDCGTKV